MGESSLRLAEASVGKNAEMDSHEPVGAGEPPIKAAARRVAGGRYWRAVTQAHTRTRSHTHAGRAHASLAAVVDDSTVVTPSDHCHSVEHLSCAAEEHSEDN